MPKSYEYKPRMGFDIRAKPTKGGRTARKSWAKQDVRTCDHPECENPAEVRAPKSPDQLNEFFWFCPVHAREHNKNWNFFEGKSESEAQKIREAARYGDRPTWEMSKNSRAAAAARASVGDEAVINDSLGVFAQSPDAKIDREAVMREGRRLTKLQISAFKTMNLQPNSSASDIRKRYAELVKRFHPDSNAGDRGAEEQLQEVIKAHQILKKANFV
ncbi:J domain-containing protein [Parvularcula flava]|uniref:J domain-containing protein n=1 Tax=Aquisalinus luteolus TaxID=1566827 RepID=A0A8J3A167_9PROT|nr:J domain-containing protein [Aquisalinus luteolus]NHK27394.1 J domain-containing protein [Aquisalinus luteolus]GGH95306.1 molecular chaperone DnaJ [Aquisalinus luteolus]